MRINIFLCCLLLCMGGIVSAAHSQKQKNYDLSWFHAKIVITDNWITVYVNHFCESVSTCPFTQ